MYTPSRAGRLLVKPWPVPSASRTFDADHLCSSVRPAYPYERTCDHTSQPHTSNSYTVIRPKKSLPFSNTTFHSFAPCSGSSSPLLLLLKSNVCLRLTSSGKKRFRSAQVFSFGVGSGAGGRMGVDSVQTVPTKPPAKVSAIEEGMMVVGKVRVRD